MGRLRPEDSLDGALAGPGALATAHRVGSGGPSTRATSWTCSEPVAGRDHPIPEAERDGRQRERFSKDGLAETTHLC